MSAILGPPPDFDDGVAVFRPKVGGIRMQKRDHRRKSLKVY